MTLASWKKVESEAKRLSEKGLKATAARSSADAFVWKAPHLKADVGKQPIDEGAMSALQALAEERGLKAKIADLFAGRIVNSSENRPALHWALRGNWKGIAT